jgi:hypothetical protein
MQRVLPVDHGIKTNLEIRTQRIRFGGLANGLVIGIRTNVAGASGVFGFPQRGMDGG